ncbi:type II secretion system F family protein [Candidatus Woesearchaeota archaeon]|nr:type II secretion system F family protein [Candidatus Woesearchaeota archaeon]
MLLRMQREIDREIVFAGRFLVVELQSGIPLYDAFVNIAKNYPSTGKYFIEIVHQVDLGTSLDDALNEAVELTPSPNFRKFLWQIVNSLKTGSDITTSLTAVIEQIQREQIIEVKRYGRKLNPLAMFYMIIAVIAPTLGTVMLVVLSSFISLEIDLAALLVIAVVLGFVQFMFLALIRSSRPAVDM